MYAVGGQTALRVPLVSAVFEHDGGRWVEGPGLKYFGNPAAVFGASTTLDAAGRPVVFGGYTLPGRKRSVGAAVLARGDTLERDKWDALPQLAHPRLGAGAALVNGCVYALGGCNGARPLQAMERLAAGATEWQPAPDMLTARYGFNAVALSGRIYAIGGTGSGGRALSSAEVFDAVSGTWSKLPSMLGPRKWASAVAARGCIWVAGGSSTVARGAGLRSVEYFDPRAASGRGAWVEGPNMLQPREMPVLFAQPDGTLIAAGGRSGDTFLRTAERLSLGAAAWERAPEFDLPIPLAGAVGIVTAAARKKSGGTATPTQKKVANLAPNGSRKRARAA